jgi:hypothetical protein
MPRGTYLSLSQLSRSSSLSWLRINTTETINKRVAEIQTDTGPFPLLMLFGIDTTVPKGDATDGSMKSTGRC